MSSEQTATSSSTFPPAKRQRVLACVLCQQRKVKCDRNFPCANCTKSRVQCVPATQLPRRRKRRFAERELLDQLRRYEDLLRRNNIKFEPLHKDSPPSNESPHSNAGYDSDEHIGITEASTPSTAVKSEGSVEVKNFWSAMRDGFRDPEEVDNSDSSHDDVGELVVKKAWDQAFLNDDHLLFGSRQDTVDLSTLHPEPAKIFRLWQLYLDNVNPVFKIIHAPTMQARIIEAVGDLKNISPILEALLFSIYCMATITIVDGAIPHVYGSVKKNTVPETEDLVKYRFGCQQALLNCGFLRTADRDVLTALLLYLVSLSTTTDPRSLSAMLGLALRIARRMKIDVESECARSGVLEGEMRRRLWYALVLFDARASLLADYKTVSLTPTWDCHVPLNVNDADLRPEMKEPPTAHAQPTEAIFAVVRSAVADFIRNSSLHLDFTAPALKPLAKLPPGATHPEFGSELNYLESTIEGVYLQACDPENPLQFMTIWDTRRYIAKCKLMETYASEDSTKDSHFSRPNPNMEAGVTHALTVLHCDTKIMTSPLSTRYLWMAPYHFPFPAYIHLVKFLTIKPICEYTDKAWELMSENCDARFGLPETSTQEHAALYRGSHTKEHTHLPLFNLFSRLVLYAWQSREAAEKQRGRTVQPPKIVTKLRREQPQIAHSVSKSRSRSRKDVPMDTGMVDFNMQSATGFADPSLPSQTSSGQASGQDSFWPEAYQTLPDQLPLDMDMNQFDFSNMDWGFGPVPTGDPSFWSNLSWIPQMPR